MNNLKFAFRQLRKNPGFTAVAVLTLALGIGANTAIFSVCDAVLLKPLPYSDPDRIVMLWEQALQSKTLGLVAPANFVVVYPPIGCILAVLSPRGVRPLRQCLARGWILILTQPQKVIGSDLAVQPESFRSPAHTFASHALPFCG